MKKIAEEDEAIMTGRKPGGKTDPAGTEGMPFSMLRKQVAVDPHPVPASCPDMAPQHAVRILHCTDGSLKLAHGPQFFLMRRGSFAVLSEGYKYTLSGQGELYELEIQTAMFRKCCELAGLDVRRLGRGMEYEENGRTCFVMSGKIGDDLRVQRILISLIEENSLSLPGYQQMIQGLLLQLAVLVRREYGESELDPLSSEAGQIRNYILRNCRYVTAAQTADTFHYHVNTVNRLLKKAYGQTFTQILQQCRLQLASQLLCRSDLPVRDVAVECGYDNLSYFYRIFQESYQMTPLQWRMQNRVGAN